MHSFTRSLALVASTCDKLPQPSASLKESFVEAQSVNYAARTTSGLARLHVENPMESRMHTAVDAE